MFIIAFNSWVTQHHYPPGTQEDYNSFSSKNLVMGKGTELEFPEGRGGGKGQQRSPGVPPTIIQTVLHLKSCFCES